MFLFSLGSISWEKKNLFSKMVVKAALSFRHPEDELSLEAEQTNAKTSMTVGISSRGSKTNKQTNKQTPRVGFTCYFKPGPGSETAKYMVSLLSHWIIRICSIKKVLFTSHSSPGREREGRAREQERDACVPLKSPFATKPNKAVYTLRQN